MNTNDYTLIEHLNEKFDLIYDPKSNNKILVRVTSLH